MGVSYSEFKHLNPYKLSLIKQGFNMQRKIRDEEMWMWVGSYVRDAVALGIRIGMGKVKFEYQKNPILSEYKDKKQNSYKESQEEVAIFEMKQRINLLRQSGLPESPD